MIFIIIILVARPNAVTVPLDDTSVFSISSDNQVRVQCQIQLGDFHFLAEVLVDKGDKEELYLSARKILQMGLRQIGKPYKSKSWHNTFIDHLRFEPVLVQITFIHDDDDDEEEMYEDYLCVHCLKSEYDTELNIFMMSQGEAINRYFLFCVQ